jgi:hypothetical protein
LHSFHVIILLQITVMKSVVQWTCNLMYQCLSRVWGSCVPKFRTHDRAAGVLTRLASPTELEDPSAKSHSYATPLPRVDYCDVCLTSWYKCPCVQC